MRKNFVARGPPKIFWYTGKFFTNDPLFKGSIFSQHLLRNQAVTIVYHTHRVHLMRASSIHFHVVGKMVVGIRRSRSVVFAQPFL